MVVVDGTSDWCGGKDKLWGQRGRDTFRIKYWLHHHQRFYRRCNRIHLGQARSAIKFRSRGDNLYIYHKDLQLLSKMFLRKISSKWKLPGLIFVGKSDTLSQGLKAIKHPKGKSSGRSCCRNPSPDVSSSTYPVSNGGIFI